MMVIGYAIAVTFNYVTLSSLGAVNSEINLMSITLEDVKKEGSALQYVDPSVFPKPPEALELTVKDIENY